MRAAHQTLPPTPAGKQLLKRYGRLPLSFQANRGQADSRVKFLSQGRGYSIFLTETEAAFSFSGYTRAQSAATAGPNSSQVVRMKLRGANLPLDISGIDRLPGTANYFFGSDALNWFTGIPTYAKVRYQSVYPGIDLVYYGHQGQLEFDFVVAPGADPDAICLSLEGGDALRIDARGNLVLKSQGGEIYFHRPRLYQEISGRRAEVPGRFMLLPSRRVKFQVGGYDHSKPLMIDPVLSYSTFLGDSSYDQGYGIAVDSSGNAYVSGQTSSWSFPTTSGALKPTRSGLSDAFVTKLNADGTALVYSTFLGGSGAEHALAIAVDSQGNAYVAGETFSSNFPTTAGALKSSYGGAGDAFFCKLSASGSSLDYSTYLGGASTDEARALALGSSGNIYLAGMTYSSDFPTMSALQVNKNDSQDAFVTELNAAGSLVYSTYLGGNSYDQANGIAVDPSGNAYVTGYTKSSDFPTANAIQNACASCSEVNDAFVAEISAGGSGLVYSTFLGGGRDDVGSGIAVDALGNAYVTGFTFSSDFPTTAGALQESLLGTASVFVIRISPNGASLLYSTYLGGDRYSYGNAIALHNSNAYVAGVTNSHSFPLASPLQASIDDGLEVFVSQMNSSGSALEFSTYLGGDGSDQANAIAVDSAGNMYVAGSTASPDFPTANALQPTYGGSNLDAFVAKIGVPVSVNLAPSSLTFANQGVGSTSSAKTVTLSNPGGASLTISSISIAGTNGGDFSQTNNCGSSVAAGGNCAIDITFTPTVTGTRNATLTIADSASGSPHTAGLTGTGVTASASLSPTSLSFSNQAVGTTSTAKNLTLSNPGGATLSISSISITGANSGDFSQSNNCGSSVAAGGNCAINVTFSPTAPGTRNATLSISDSASGSPHAAALTGTGVTASLTFSPSSLSFSNQVVGTTSTAKIVTLSNPGGAALTISSISITGTNSGDFSQSDNCGSSVAAGENCAINVTFSPTATGARNATLTISDSATGSPHTAGLAGTGITSDLTLSASSLTFAGQAVGTSSAAQSVTLSNPGAAPVNISSITIAGANSGDFSQSNNCGASLAAGASCTINVTFTPTAAGRLSGTLVFTDDAQNSPQSVSLSGEGKDFDLAIASGSSPSETVIAGGTASYSLILSPVGGFSEPVSLACSGAPTHATCAVSPSSIILDGANAQSVKVTLTTTVRSLVPPVPRNIPPAPRGLPIHFWVLALLLTASLAIALRRCKPAPFLAGAVLLAAVTLGCGGGMGGGFTTGVSSSQGTPAGTYTLTISATSGSLTRQTTLKVTIQ